MTLAAPHDNPPHSCPPPGAWAGWPGILSRNHLFMTAPHLEDPASRLHSVGGLVAALLGRPERYLVAFALYQLYTAAAKTLLFPGHGLADGS